MGAGKIHQVVEFVDFANVFRAIKAFRRIATRYEKTDRCCAAMINLVAVLRWIR
jgi:hypothetical protein